MTTSDDAERRYTRAREIIGRAKQGLIEGHRLLNGLSKEVTSARARGAIHQQIWDCERYAGKRPQFFSQSGQDAFLDERVFQGKRDGVFIEVGGYDGITGSNCLFFELIRGWHGLVIEPSPTYHAMCTTFRRSPCLKLAVGAKRGTAEFLDVQQGLRQMSGLVGSYDPELRSQVESDPRHKGEVIEVKVQTLEQILDAHHLREIDYISLDVEGAELDVLTSFPFEKYRITALTIENNSGDIAITELMRSKGYKRIEAIGVDDVYLFDPDQNKPAST
ncbi:MAG: FkbM family methyltransferase [Pseudomonadota bacterium]